MRIRLVTQWYPPEPAGVPAGIARGLAVRGHAVDVLTGFPNYPSGELAPGYPLRPYRRDLDRGEWGDVVVHRAPLFPSHDARAVTRAANYLSFAVASTALSLSRLPRPDVWLTYSSPVTASMPALAARLMRRAAPTRLRDRPAAHAQIIQDLWPDSVLESGLVRGGGVTRPLTSALDAFCSYSYRSTDAIGVISPGMRRILVERGIPNDTILDTPNWVDADRLPRSTPSEIRRRRRALGLPEKGRLFVYAGNLGELQALPALVDGFEKVPEAALALIGPGVMRARLSERIGCSERIRLLPAQSPERIAEFLACADVLVVSLADVPLLRVTMPSKVAACLGAGRPVLAHAAGDAADVVTASGGLAAPPGDTATLAACISEMTRWSESEFERRDAAARAWYEANANAESCRDSLEGLVRSAADRAVRSRTAAPACTATARPGKARGSQEESS